MLEVMKKEQASPLTLKATPRVERIREAFLDLKPVFEIHRARIFTRVMRATEGEPMVIRRAKAFCATVREMPCNIDPDELFVGHVNGTWAGQQVSPERGTPVEEILDYKDREYFISEENERELREEIIPYWKGPDGNWNRIRSFDHYEVDSGEQFPSLSIRKPNAAPIHYGHECVNYEKVLKKGFLGIKKDAEERLAAVTEKPDEWPHVERRKNHALRKNVDELLQQLRQTYGELQAMTDDEVAEVEHDFLSRAHIIWERLLAERKGPEGAGSPKHE